MGKPLFNNIDDDYRARAVEYGEKWQSYPNADSDTHRAGRACTNSTGKWCIAGPTDYSRLGRRLERQWADRQLHLAGGDDLRVYNHCGFRLY